MRPICCSPLAALRCSRKSLAISTVLAALVLLSFAPPTRAAADGCAALARLHASGLQPTVDREHADALRGRPIANARPAAPIGRCWTATDGAVWGLILSDLKATESVWESGAIALDGDVVVVRIAPDGTTARERVGPYVEGPGCPMTVRAELLSPPDGLLVDVAPGCGEAGMDWGARWVVARGGRLVQPASSLAPLTLLDDAPRNFLSHGVVRVELPGGHSGNIRRAFPVPYRIGDDGQPSLDVDALAIACDGRAWSNLEDPAETYDSDELLTAFGCDWFRGVDLRAAIKRATSTCPTPPKRRAGEDADAHWSRVYDAMVDAPPLCNMVEEFSALSKTKPPARIGATRPATKPMPVDRVPVQSVRSVGVVPDYRSFSFGADQLVDGRLDTCWQPMSNRPHVGAWVRFDLRSTARIDAVDIANGFQRTDALGDLFAMNDRLIEGWLVFGPGDAVPFTLDPQKLGYQSVRLDPPRVTDHVTLLVAEGAGGSRWRHLALSEVAFRGDVVPEKAPAVGLWGELSAALIAYCGDARTSSGCAPVLARWLSVGSEAGAKQISGASDRRQVVFDGSGASHAVDFERSGGGPWKVTGLR